jgi:hypothetical protein
VRGSFKTTSHEIEGRWKYGSFDDRGFCLIFAPVNVTMSSFFKLARNFLGATALVGALYWIRVQTLEQRGQCAMRPNAAMQIDARTTNLIGEPSTL